MLGFLNLDKPTGVTSHDCVARVRCMLRIKRVGHGGTLDPAATGVLPLAVGKATRLLQFLPEHKAYQATIRLGVRTTTDDLEGEVIETRSNPGLNLDQVQPLVKQFEGKISQVPPAYSAIQQGGKRLYELARAGETVEVPTRTVEVPRMEVLEWHAGEFPELVVAIACGSGTYIRAIARDLGASLNTGGTLASLTRTESSGFHLAQSITLEQLENQFQQGTFQPIPPTTALAHLSAVTLPADNAKRWCQGQRISIPKAEEQRSRGENNTQFAISVRVHHEDGHFLGIGELVNSDTKQLLAPKIVLESV
ncbi:MAG: tRNA pseudouridine(55) synthase TruB [Cyanobacteria bacterium QS_7_48_42]|nr:MAG: tRNA pseudouridine(55) synthase TruB [Cyanobacteria bacterium QH_10_48_56]PSO66909.1 MAG: tRNA pseudouridine(55) synthase TruB [Cyanobacteria bacterium QH_7_48_89]PSO74373.1 MAG: tRNA pseudouridine(55) synthase TruB [Cyanobacteria bacterium QH_3_48_40]PSO85784.1 MAG: tRNA pseudouridine(55) synthase TruB [Cyanobacteria bacterium QH_9_48_43]PSO94844.1 MAG: tRNA pseudouridine(55) synthase TruB [Cyanobacteria bacterium QS_6_48_18]PSP01041.1 MAG: tRNA pseudouridine(55) synthase TruB [Cyanob